jgi:hypothetical protein
VEKSHRDKILFPKRSLPTVSLIAALNCHDHLLLAADSLITESNGVRMTCQKLDFMTDRAMAWGFAGSEGIGLAFGKWLKSWEWPSDATWDVVSDRAAEELSRLNGRRRELAQIAGVAATEDDLVTVLVAGYLAGAPDIVEISDKGAAVSVMHNEFAAVGSGQAHAMMVNFTATAARMKFKEPKYRLAFIVEVAATHAPLCAPPVRVLRITATGVEDMTSVPKPAEE